MKRFLAVLIIAILIGQIAYARDIGNVRGFGADTPERIKVGQNYKELKMGMYEYETIELLGEPFKTNTSITENGTVNVNIYI